MQLGTTTVSADIIGAKTIPSTLALQSMATLEATNLKEKIYRIPKKMLPPMIDPIKWFLPNTFFLPHAYMVSYKITITSSLSSFIC